MIHCRYCYFLFLLYWNFGYVWVKVLCNSISSWYVIDSRFTVFEITANTLIEIILFFMKPNFLSKWFLLLPFLYRTIILLLTISHNCNFIHYCSFCLFCNALLNSLYRAFWFYMWISLELFLYYFIYSLHSGQVLYNFKVFN